MGNEPPKDFYCLRFRFSIVIMKRSSPLQLETMVTFMEEHGDLNKPTNNAKGKIETLRRWEQLTSLLNSDGTGDSKPTEKWKKVWSDLKNNTKKKAARLHKAASGTGGGPAVYAKITDLEQRVLNLIGLQVATGLALEEAGFSQDNPTVNIVDATEAAIENLEDSQVEQNQHNFTKRGNYLICETENSSSESQTMFTEESLPKKTKLSTDSEKTFCDLQEECPDSQSYDDNITYCKENDKYDLKDAFMVTKTRETTHNYTTTMTREISTMTEYIGCSINEEKEYQCNDFFGRIVALELSKFHGNMRYNKMKEILDILKENNS